MYHTMRAWFGRIDQPILKEPSIEDLLENRYPAKIPWPRPITDIDYLTIWLYQALDPITQQDGTKISSEAYWELYRQSSLTYGLNPISYDGFRDEYLEAHYTVLFVIQRQEALWTTTIVNDEPATNKGALTWSHLIDWYTVWMKKWRLTDSTKSWGLFLRQATLAVGERLLQGWEDLPTPGSERKDAII